MFYVVCLIFPILLSGDCESGTSITMYLIEAFFVVASFLAELGLIIYLYRQVDDREMLHINKYHIQAIMIGQMAKLNFFTDVMFIVQLYKCEIDKLLILSVTVLIICNIYPFFMLFRLLTRNNN
jgi:hypothetical protein